MFFILETQVDQSGNGAILPAVTKQNRNQAEAAYYRILQYAAVSSVYKHGAIIFNEDCMPIMYKVYDHEKEEEEE